MRSSNQKCKDEEELSPEKLSNINFRPWVGKRYFKGGYKGKKILVLGESHYCKEELSEQGRCCPSCIEEKMHSECFSQTEDNIADYLEYYTGVGFQQTYLCFERAIEGKELTIEEREEFWQGVIFYNYIQYSLCSARQQLLLEDAQWKKCEVCFREILETYMPDYIIVWGDRLYESLPNWGGKGSEIKLDDNSSTSIWTYFIKGKHMPALRVLHPSIPKGKKWVYWHQFYKIFLCL